MLTLVCAGGDLYTNVTIMSLETIFAPFTQQETNSGTSKHILRNVERVQSY